MKALRSLAILIGEKFTSPGLSRGVWSHTFHHPLSVPLYRLAGSRVLFPFSTVKETGVSRRSRARETSLPHKLKVSDHEWRIVILGRPNVGKSTLFNRLALSKQSLTDRSPGVTRDRIEAEGYLAGLNLKLIDTAGLTALPFHVS